MNSSMMRHDDHKTVLFRIVQESLTNIRNSEATEVKLSIVQKNDKVQLRISNGGKGGFRPDLEKPEYLKLLAS